MSVIPQLQSAIKMHQAGNYPDAEQLYRQVLAIAPNNVDALHLLGLLKYQTGDAATAVDLIEEAIRINPRVSNLYNNAGEAYRALGQLKEAVRYYRRAIKLDPQNVMAYNNLALALMKQESFNEASKHLKTALRISPDYVEASYNLGRLLFQQKRFDEALEQLQKTREIKPDFYPVYPLLGQICHTLGEHRDALNYFNEAIAHNPDDMALVNNKGLALIELGELDEAISLFKELLKRYPDVAEAHCNLGVALSQLDHLNEAMECFIEAVSLNPEYLEAQRNIASTLRDMGHVDKSIEAFQKIIQQHPDLANAHFGLAFSLLLKGDYENGWREYEWRWSSSNSPQQKPKLKGKEWHGESLSNTTILIYCEQGAGDAIQFIRFIPMLAVQGATVILQCQAALLSLFEQAEGVDQIITFETKPKHYDFHCPILSLPLHLDISLENLPSTVPYLFPTVSDLDNIELDKSKLHVGVVWAGSQLHINDRKRSCSVELFAPLAEIEKIELHSLQKHSTDETVPAFLIDHNDQLQDYNDTAALIKKLDLVISVDTSVAHLAGALGKPVWILLPHAPDWRWLREGEDSPWYSTATLFRQATAGDWAGVIAKVEQHLSDVIKE